MALNAGSLGNVFIRATRPPQTWLIPRDPTPYDTQGYDLLDEWLNTITNTPWLLVSLKGNNMSRGEVALWINMGGSGGIVISVVGGNNITITGTPTNPIVNVSGTTNHSVQLGAANGALNSLANGTTGMVLTAQTGADPIWAAAAVGTITTLTGNSGGAVSPTAGNINVIGTGVITVVGNPGTSTLTVTPSGDIASSFITNPVTGTATPVSGVLTFAGTGDVTVSASGSTVTINGSGSGTVTTLHTQDGNNVTPTSGVINVSGANGLTTTGTVGPNTVTITADGTIAQSFITNPVTGTATPAAGVLTFAGAGGTVVSAAGSTVTINAGGAVFSNGTFTPVLRFGGASTGITYSVQQGYYSLIGNLCAIYVEIRLTSKGSSTGGADFIGLPFTKLGTVGDIDMFITSILGITYPAGTTCLHGAIDTATNKVNINGTGSGVAVANLQDTDFTNTSVFKCQGTYFTV